MMEGVTQQNFFEFTIYINTRFFCCVTPTITSDKMTLLKKSTTLTQHTECFWHSVNIVQDCIFVQSLFLYRYITNSMKYNGYFQNINGVLCRVELKTKTIGNDVDLLLSGETPVLITTESDGILSPIKSRSCTISVITPQSIEDIYSPTAHGTEVRVYEGDKIIFFGYVTPCEYSQAYAESYDELEIECIDAISTLRNIKYVKENEGFISFKEIILNARKSCGLSDTSGTYVQSDMSRASQNGVCPISDLYIDDSIFLGDTKEENDSYYDVLESMFKFLGCSLVVIDGVDWYIIDYQQLENKARQERSPFFNLNSGSFIMDNNDKKPNITSLTFDDYQGDGHTMELDEVYNHVKVTVDSSEIDDDKFFVDPTDEKNITKSAFIRTSAQTYKTKNTHKWKRFLGSTNVEVGMVVYDIYDRTFYFTKKQINNKPTNDNWQCYANTNVREEGASWFRVPVLTSKLDNQFLNYIDIDSNYLWTSRLARYEYQWCTIDQQFGYLSGKGMPTSVEWKPYILFHTGQEALARYFNDVNTGIDNTDGNNLYKWNDFCSGTLGMTSDYTNFTNPQTFHNVWKYIQEKLCMVKPMLKYTGDEYINYSPADTEHTNYITFKGDLLWQKPGYFGTNESGTSFYHPLYVSGKNYKEYLSFPLDDAGYNDEENKINFRGSGESDYNKGWKMLKCRLKIGNKYYNGSTWTTTESDFWISYHKENVNGDDETLDWYEWNSPVVNHDYNIGIGDDCFIIPIKNSDNVCGKMEFSIYCPKCPLPEMTSGKWYGNPGSSAFIIDKKGTIYPAKSNGDTQYTQTANNDTYIKINTDYTVPVIFMKDLELGFVSRRNYAPADDSAQHWIFNIKSFDNEEDEDIEYQNTINDDNVVDGDEIDLKISTYSDKKPRDKQYVFKKIGNESYSAVVNFYNGDSLDRQELHLIQKYTTHYTNPMKIYEAEINRYLRPDQLVSPTAIPDVIFCVDTQEYDVKEGKNTVRLVQFSPNNGYTSSNAKPTVFSRYFELGDNSRGVELVNYEISEGNVKGTLKITLSGFDETCIYDPRKIDATFSVSGVTLSISGSGNLISFEVPFAYNKDYDTMSMDMTLTYNGTVSQPETPTEFRGTRIEWRGLTLDASTIVEIHEGSVNYSVKWGEVGFVVTNTSGTILTPNITGVTIEGYICDFSQEGNVIYINVRSADEEDTGDQNPDEPTQPDEPTNPDSNTVVYFDWSGITLNSRYTFKMTDFNGGYINLPCGIESYDFGVDLTTYNQWYFDVGVYATQPNGKGTHWYWVGGHRVASNPEVIRMSISAHQPEPYKDEGYVPSAPSDGRITYRLVWDGGLGEENFPEFYKKIGIGMCNRTVTPVTGHTLWVNLGDSYCDRVYEEDVYEIWNECWEYKYRREGDILYITAKPELSQEIYIVWGCDNTDDGVFYIKSNKEYYGVGKHQQQIKYLQAYTVIKKDTFLGISDVIDSKGNHYNFRLVENADLDGDGRLGTVLYID